MPAPDTAVPVWLDAQNIETLFMSAIAIAEFRFGIASMPSGKRQNIFYDRLEGEVLPHFDGRIPPFNLNPSQFYTQLMASGRVLARRSARLMDILLLQQRRNLSQSQRETHAH